MFAFDHEVTLRADSAPDFKFSLRARLSICLRIPVSYENILNAHAGFIPARTVLMKGTTEDLSGVSRRIHPGQNRVDEGGY